MELRVDLLGQPKPVAVMLERVVGVDAALHADLRRPHRHRLGDPGLKVVLGDLVGVGRALALAEAAEGAADDADVGEVDVAVDDECRGLAGELGSQLVGGGAHRLDDLGTRLGEERGELVLGELLSPASLLDRRRCELRVDRDLAAPARALARDEAPVLQLHHVEDALLDPVGVEVLRIDAEALRERVPARREPLAHLVRARKGVLGRDVVAVRGEAAEVGRPLLDQVVPPVGEIRRDLDADAGHETARLGDQRPHLVERDIRCPLRHRNQRSARLLRFASGGGRVNRGFATPSRRRSCVGDVSDFGAVVPRVRNEVLEDHLLEVAVLLVHFGERLERLDPLRLALPDPDEDAAGERDLQLSGPADRLQASRRILRRRALVDDEVGVDRFEHQPLRRGHLAQTGEVIAGEDAEIRMREQAALERPLTRPDDVGREVVVAVLGQAPGYLRVHLRHLAGEDEQLLRVSAHRLFEPLLDLVGRVEVRAMGRERAVLAVTATRTRQRERVVAREGDAPHASEPTEEPLRAQLSRHLNPSVPGGEAEEADGTFVICSSRGPRRP